MINKKTRFLLIIVAASFIVSSCASVRTASDSGGIEEGAAEKPVMFEKALSGIKSVSILGDVCIAEHLGNLLLDESISADKDAIDGVAAIIKTKKIRTVLCPRPYVGSYIVSDTPAKVKAGETTEDVMPPFARPRMKDEDKAYDDALMAAITSITALEGKDAGTRNQSFRQDESIASGLSLIAGKTGTDALLVFFGQGLKYLRDEPPAVGSGTGIGLQRYSTSPLQIIDVRKDYIRGAAALIDLKTKTVLWSNIYSLELPEKGKPDGRFYGRTLPDAILDMVPGK